MVNKNGADNIVHCGSISCKLTKSSVMAAKIQKLVHGFDLAFFIRDIIVEIIGGSINIAEFVDRKNVLYVIAKKENKAERRIRIDICESRELYSGGDIGHIAWIPGPSSPTDTLTKGVLKQNTPLETLMSTNVFQMESRGWASVDQEERKPHK